jgi:hypothetical protein
LWPYINRGRIETSFYVRGVELIDHLDTGSAVFGDMMDIPSLHQAAADVGVAMAASGQTRKSSVSLGMSGVGGKAEVDFGRLEVCL